MKKPNTKNTTDHTTTTRFIATPLGKMRLVATSTGLTAADWGASSVGEAWSARAPKHAVLDRAASEIDAYFQGTLRRFTVPLAPEGTTFQRAVWKRLAAIPYGKTKTYADIAREVGIPTGARAVGNANGKNPVCIIVPCHRVIGASGALTGFAWGVERKAKLLSLEA